MDYRNNFQISMNYLLKYETYRILKLYAYLFFIFAVSYFMEFNVRILPLGISYIIFLSLLSLPLVYCFFLFFVIKSKMENYQFKISFKLIILVISILAIFVIVPNSFVFLNINPAAVSGILDSYITLINRYLLSVAIALIITFSLLRKFKSFSENYIFLGFGLVYLISWVLETYYAVYTYTWLLFILSGVIFYLYSSVFLKRDLT